MIGWLDSAAAAFDGLAVMSYFAAEIGELFVYIAYFGIGSAGKTTNVRALNDRTDPTRSDKILSVFDESAQFQKDMWSFLHPVRVRGVPVRVHVLWRGGMHFDHNAEKYFLRGGLDGAIWVVDSQRTRIEANEEYLEDVGDLVFDTMSTFTVMQFNKRDAADAAPITMLEEVLNPYGLDTFEAVAARGIGVAEPMEALTTRIFATHEATMS